MPYIANTEDHIKEMLDVLNVKSIDELLEDIPSSIRLKSNLNIDSGLSEIDTIETVSELADQNVTIPMRNCFIGGGIEYHHIPPVVKQLVLRSEFYTSYTPYQPEISQGMLQAIFEYQTYICRLTGMDVSNASSYDGGTAMSDAILMAVNKTRSKNVVFAKSVNPEYIRVYDTYNIGIAGKRTCLPEKNGDIDYDALEKVLQEEKHACIVAAMPNYYGYIDDYARLSEIAKANKCVFIVILSPFCVSLLKKPGELGADIVVGEGQSLGCPTYLAGATIGFLAAKKDFMRLVPGRIAGKTKDEDGKIAYVLTLQAREQHIRREKALSNICTNQALLALWVNIYLSSIGEQGFKDIAKTSTYLAHYAKEKIEASSKLSLLYPNKHFFNTFLVKVDTDDINSFYRKVMDKNFAPGVIMEKDYTELKNVLSLTFTEVNTKESIDKLIKTMDSLA